MVPVEALLRYFFESQHVRDFVDHAHVLGRSGNNARLVHTAEAEAAHAGLMLGQALGEATNQRQLDLLGSGHDRSRSLAEEFFNGLATLRSEEHTSELQSLMRISYAVFCLKKKK